MRRSTLAAVALALVATACSGGSIVPGQGRGTVATPRELELRLELAANLEPFGDCGEVLDYFEEQVRSAPPGVLPPLPGVPGDATGPINSVAGGDIAVAGGERVVVADSAASGGAGIQAEGGAAASGGPALLAPPDGGDFSSTNIQEAGVDEPDIVKTDGERIVVAGYRGLQVVDPAGPRLVGTLDLPEGGHELFLQGDRVIVLTSASEAVPVGTGAGSAFVAGPGTVGYPPTTVVTAIDLSDPARPTTADSVKLVGEYLAARLHDGVVRLVLRTSPDPYIVNEPERAGVEDWLPQRIEGDATEPLVGCDSVVRPPEPSGLGTVTIVTIDAAGAMEPIDTDAVVADAQTVYASTDTLYIGTAEWTEPESIDSTELSTTELHAFDISGPRETRYVASGRIRGRMLNQWSLSEHAGHLRVATTDGPAWATLPEEGPASESYVTVLRRDGDQLVTVGQVGGLGRGEQIFAVRYVGDLGFVVTFRQTDPLYAVDLSDPANPRLLGELKIPGFSAYLHPIEGGRMVGVGQDATDDGSQLGTQVSLFDVSDPTNLRRLDQERVDYSTSLVEHDHRAFVWWASRDLALVPIEAYGFIEPDVLPLEPGDRAESRRVPPEPFNGLVAFRMSGDEVDVAGRVTNAGSFPIRRSLVIGDTLFTVSEVGVTATGLDDFQPRGEATF